MTKTGSKTQDENATASKMMELVTGGWMSQALYVVAELRIADLLAERPRTCEELAELTGSDARALGQLLRALTTIDICRQCAEGRFDVTPLGLLLRVNEPGSLRLWIIWWGKYLWPLWGRLLECVRTGQSARKQLFGTEGFIHLERDREAADIFYGAAAVLTRLTAEEVVQVYDFSPTARIVDVGGGSGEMLAAILRSVNGVRAVLFDRPQVIEQGRRQLEAEGLASRCEFVPGNFFERVPTGGDIYILKSVIHDWNDENSRVILDNCRQEMSGDGRLLLLEEMCPEQFTVSPAHQAIARGDLTMLVAHAAQERTEAELRRLLIATGFAVSRVIPVGSTFTLIEAVVDSHSSR